MDAIWFHLVIGVVAGCSGAGLVLWVRGSATPAPVAIAPEGVRLPEPTADSWSPLLWRCEQAVRRGRAAVESLSSRRARNRLQTVVRRMDAELPDVRVLAELGKGLGDTPRDVEVARRVRAQLADTAERFAQTTDRVLELVAEPVGLDQHVKTLREDFPLVRPLAAVLTPPVSRSKDISREMSRPRHDRVGS